MASVAPSGLWTLTPRLISSLSSANSPDSLGLWNDPLGLLDTLFFYDQKLELYHSLGPDVDPRSSSQIPITQILSGQNIPVVIQHTKL